MTEKESQNMSAAIAALAKCYETVDEIRRAIRRNDAVETQNLLYRLCQRLDNVREPILSNVSADIAKIDQAAENLLKVL